MEGNVIGGHLEYACMRCFMVKHPSMQSLSLRLTEKLWIIR